MSFEYGDYGLFFLNKIPHYYKIINDTNILCLEDAVPLAIRYNLLALAYP